MYKTIKGIFFQAQVLYDFLTGQLLSSSMITQLALPTESPSKTMKTISVKAAVATIFFLSYILNKSQAQKSLFLEFHVNA